MTVTNPTRTNEAHALIDDFLIRTGAAGEGAGKQRRYLWTDAFAVRTCFALAEATGDESYRRAALRLIEDVHRVLGGHREDDPREGWISGLSEQEGERHPAAGGLRIGKPLPEREPGEPFDERLEWERDGQYFHYLAQWLPALLHAERETGDGRYGLWAAELAKASEKFIVRNGPGLRMFWKMSIDLSHPLVTSMGAHDPLSGLMGVECVLDQVPGQERELQSLRDDFARLCAGGDWATSDPLGVGGLLLSLLAAAKLEASGRNIPREIGSAKLLGDALRSLRAVHRSFDAEAPANHRLAFRECGLSLGLRAVQGCVRSGDFPEAFEEVSDHLVLADEIETFWCEPTNREARTWREHQDINAVTLAASLAAGVAPAAFA